MSKKPLLLTAVALLSLAGAERATATTTASATSTSTTPSANTTSNTAIEQFKESSLDLLNQLDELMQQGDELVINADNHRRLTSSIAKIKQHVAQAELLDDYEGKAEMLDNLDKLRQSLEQLVTLQYDLPAAIELVTKSIPTLATQPTDDKVAFDKHLEELMKATELWLTHLPSLEKDYDKPEDYKQELAYFKAVKTYLEAFKDKREGKVVTVPEVPVYWRTKKDETTTSSSSSKETTTTSTTSSTSSTSSSTQTESAAGQKGKTSDKDTAKDKFTDDKDAKAEEDADKEDADDKTGKTTDSGSTGLGGVTRSYRVLPGTNHQRRGALPKTGDKTAPVLTVLGLALSVLGLVALKGRRD